MPKINQLSFAVANLIAAGEVVDRPASVVKELLENAIDAGATAVTVEIARGGVAMIRVSDNGCGMEKEDLPIAIRRHATSKISGAEDLESIMTLGFRGEALAAISAVSRVRILSKTADAETGYLLSSVCGTNVDICEVGCADGTTVIVEDLFFNVPARRKFLKKDVTEAIAVSAVVEKIALSRPGVAFTYIVDGQERFVTAGDGKVKNALYAVFGRDFAAKLIPVDAGYDGIRVYGYTGRSDNCRANRNMQNFFINGRFVRSKTAMAALEQAYASYIAEGKFPVCALFIEISPAAVDVNVHPAKMEVKFSNEKAVFEAIYFSVRSAMEKDTAKSGFSFPSVSREKTGTSANATFRPATGAFVPLTDRTKDAVPPAPFGTDPADGGTDGSDTVPLRAAGGAETGFYRPSVEPSPRLFPGEPVVRASDLWSSVHETIPFRGEESVPEKSPAPHTAEDPFGGMTRERPDVLPEKAKREPTGKAIREEKDEEETVLFGTGAALSDYRVIGICFDTYILVEQGTKLLLIDKHAAHERIIFEQLKDNMRKSAHPSQMLMLPIDLALSPEEYDAAREYGEEIRRAGFDFSLDEERGAHICMIPDLLTTGAASDLFVGILGDLAAGTGDAVLSRDAVYEKALYQASCKAAMKGGRADLFDNVKWICDTLMAIPDIRVCPHGRPVITELEKRVIDRQFDRIK